MASAAKEAFPLFASRASHHAGSAVLDPLALRIGDRAVEGPPAGRPVSAA